VVNQPASEVEPSIPMLLVGSQLVLVAVALRNIRRPGLMLAALGAALNLAVIVANGGMMPIAPETLQRAGRIEPWKIGDGSIGTHVARSKDVILRREDTRLEILADRFWTGLPAPLSSVFSVGDVLLLAGISVLVVRTMAARGADECPRGNSFFEESHDPRGTPQVGAAA
jgi:hypothetical protein